MINILLITAIILIIILIFNISKLSVSGFGSNDKPMDHDNANNFTVWDTIDYIRPTFVSPIPVKNNSVTKGSEHLLKFSYDRDLAYKENLAKKYTYPTGDLYQHNLVANLTV